MMMSAPTSRRAHSVRPGECPWARLGSAAPGMGRLTLNCNHVPPPGHSASPRCPAKDSARKVSDAGPTGAARRRMAIRESRPLLRNAQSLADGRSPPGGTSPRPSRAQRTSRRHSPSRETAVRRSMTVPWVRVPGTVRSNSPEIDLPGQAHDNYTPCLRRD